MSLVLDDRKISQVKLIDDDPGVRSTYRYSVEDLDLQSIEIFGPIDGFDSLRRDIEGEEIAVICDYNLKVGNYSSINGDQVVSGLYKLHVPVVLCTRFDGHLPLAIRNNLRYIPVVLPPSDLSAERLRLAFYECVREFKGEFTSSRKPHRAQVRIEGGEISIMKDSVIANVIVPSWDPEQLISVEVPKSWAIYERVATCVRLGEIDRLFAQVNLGADSADELFLAEWSES